MSLTNTEKYLLTLFTPPVLWFGIEYFCRPSSRRMNYYSPVAIGYAWTLITFLPLAAVFEVKPVLEWFNLDCRLCYVPGYVGLRRCIW